MKTSRSFFSEVERRFSAMPFTLRCERLTVPLHQSNPLLFWLTLALQLNGQYGYDKTNFCMLKFCIWSEKVMVYTLPFSIRAFEDEAKARLGVVECAKHELLQPFSVLQEKEGECLWVTPLLLLIFTYSPPHSLSALRRVCSPVQVHSAAHGQRASQNHQRTPGSWALQVGARSPGPRTQGKLMNVCPTASWCTGNGSTVRWCNSL